MHRHFDDELNQLKKKLLQMSSLVEESISLSMKALVDRDSTLAENVIQSDDAINMLEIDVDEFAIKMIALRQPEARDLRFITAILKINTDLERMGDHAVNIAERTLILLKEPLLKPLIDIPKMAELAQNMVRDCLNAFVNKDVVLAQSVCERDNNVDQLNEQLFRELLTYMMQDARNIERALNLMFVAKNIERIADLSTNISEDVIYMTEGRVIKHHFKEKENR
ncbi:MAG: phosphate signaling complex protein PhoU [Chlamydiota bacterium]|nr:phosphate signaling complex protein PhoU [Chlamydiota bacterium]